MSMDKTLVVKKVHGLRYAIQMCSRLLQQKSLGFNYQLFYNKKLGIHKNDRGQALNNIIDVYLGDIRYNIERRMNELSSEERRLVNEYNLKI
jgi:uncharacterized Fe-S radical SAM superfamily protein PflX